MRVALIDPKGSTKGLNTGLGYICSSLLSNCTLDELRVFDFNNSDEPFQKKLAKIKGYDLVGVSVKSFTKRNALEIIREIRPYNKVVVAGGPHCATDELKFLQDNEDIDIVVPSEGEKVAVELIDWLSSKKCLEEVQGISYKNNGEPTAPPCRPLEKDLDSLPFPDYTCFDSVNAMYNYPLITSRGCPYKCTFCSVSKVAGRKWRYRSIENVIEELKIAQKRYHFHEFEILDDNFTLNMKRAKEFSQALIEQELNMKWSCPNGIRADRVDEELLTLMKKAGCYLIMFGIESGDEKIFNSINKGESLEQVRRVIQFAQKIGICVRASFIIGLPGSDMASFKKSLTFAEKLKLSSAGWNILVPYPTTEVYDWMLREAKILHPWEEGFHFGIIPKPTFETNTFSEKEMIRAYFIGNIRCKNYRGLIDHSKGTAFNAWRMGKLVLKYDPLNSPVHIFEMLKIALKKILRK